MVQCSWSPRAGGSRWLALRYPLKAALRCQGTAMLALRAQLQWVLSVLRSTSESTPRCGFWSEGSSMAVTLAETFPPPRLPAYTYSQHIVPRECFDAFSRPFGSVGPHPDLGKLANSFSCTTLSWQQGKESKATISGARAPQPRRVQP